MMDHSAIYKAYAGTVVRISDSQGAFDADGNSVEIDQALVDAARSELDTENAWSDLRAKRDQFLSATDWEIIKHKELGTTIPAALKTYRQELRDLPANTSDPANPSWPVKP